MFESSGMPAAASHQSFHSRAEFMPTLTNGSRADVAPTLHIGPTLTNGSRADVAPTLHIGSRAHVVPTPTNVSALTQALSRGSPEVVAIHGYDARPTAPAALTLARASSLDSQRVVCHEAAGADASVEEASDAIKSTCSLLNALEDREREKVVQGRANAKAKPKSMSSAKDKDHKHNNKEHTPKKRCSLKTPDKEVTPEKLPKTALVKKQHKAIAAKRPYFALEKQRGQFMCRTGVGGAGSTYKISFGQGKQHRSESAARKAAEHWLHGECALRGFECK